MNNLFDLTENQERAFKRLKKAHADCLKSGVFFYNNYGTLGALDSEKINDFDGRQDENSIEDHGENKNWLDLNCGEYSDDLHFFHPTK